MYRELWLALILTFTVAALSCSRPRVASDSVDPAPVFVSHTPQSIYAADPNDPWNRIFRALFTRTVNVRVSDAFPEGAPFVQFHGVGMSGSLRISKEKFSRTEVGDRAIEPMYPSFFTVDGPLQVLSEPRFSELTAALREAIAEADDRSPLERALMQADAWAAYDIMYARRFDEVKTRASLSKRRTELLGLLRLFTRKLALSSNEISSLKNNYLVAVSDGKLPDLFSPETGWLEIELLPHRHHDEAASYRRAARVFVKPGTPPSDPAQFAESLKHNQNHDQVEAVALAVQNLLIDTDGRVVPSPLLSDVQFRFFNNDHKTRATSAAPQQFELSRRKLLTEPTTGGLVEHFPTSPAYLTTAGNDYDFATPVRAADAPVIAPLRMRCAQCHGSSLTNLLTYSIHDVPPVPAVRILKSIYQQRAFYVAHRKEQRDDFRSLFATR